MGRPPVPVEGTVEGTVEIVIEADTSGFRAAAPRIEGTPHGPVIVTPDGVVGSAAAVDARQAAVEAIDFALSVGGRFLHATAGVDEVDRMAGFPGRCGTCGAALADGNCPNGSAPDA